MSDQTVKWVTRVYIDGKFARWSDSDHNTEMMRDGTTRDTWSCAEDAWRDIWGWRKINRAGGAPGNERSRTTYRLVRLTRKSRAEKCGYCRDALAEVERLKGELALASEEDVVRVGSRLWRCEGELLKSRVEVEGLQAQLAEALGRGAGVEAKARRSAFQKGPVGDG